VLVLTAAGVVVLAMVAGLALASTVMAGHRASAAADLAALGAAAARSRGASPAQACGQAARVAALNGAGLQACAVTTDDSVTVATAAPVTLVLPGLGLDVVRARARAGPEPGG
jgi:secretion/DNA translocation related TadE-like protein